MNPPRKKRIQSVPQEWLIHAQSDLKLARLGIKKNERTYLKPIAIKERNSILFLKYGEIDVIDGAFVLVDKNGVRTHIPVGGVACLLLEPGTRVSHAAVVLAARAGTLLIWVGESGVRLDAMRQVSLAARDLIVCFIRRN